MLKSCICSFNVTYMCCVNINYMLILIFQAQNTKKYFVFGEYICFDCLFSMKNEENGWQMSKFFCIWGIKSNHCRLPTVSENWWLSTCSIFSISYLCLIYTCIYIINFNIPYGYPDNISCDIWILQFLNCKEMLSFST